MSFKPKYEHDCDCCDFIKTHNNKDYYYCKNENSYGGWSLIVRDGDEPWENASYNAQWFRNSVVSSNEDFSEMSLILMHYLAQTEKCIDYFS